MSEDIYTTTFEDVEQTALEFMRVAIRLPKYDTVIVMDDMIHGPGFIKQFDDTPYGYTLARRWAVRMRDEDEDSEQPFEDLRTMYLQQLGREDGEE